VGCGRWDLWKIHGCASKGVNPILLLMTKFFFSIITSLIVWRAVAQTGDTQGVALQLTAKTSLYDRVAVLNYIQNQEYEEAIAYLGPILQADSGNSGLLGYAGYAYYMNEDYRSSGACYRRLLGIDSNNIPALHYLLLMDMSDHPADALGYASRLVRLQYDRASWWRMSGELLARMNQRDSAMICYDQAYALAPRDVRTIAGLADLLMGSKAFDRVDTMLNAAMALDSLNPTLNKLTVRSAYLSQHYARAIDPGERLVRSDEPAVQALTWLALSGGACLLHGMVRNPVVIESLPSPVSAGGTEDVLRSEAFADESLRANPTVPGTSRPRRAA